ncbi:MAG: chemotaxis protein CheW [Gemmatimonadaceae bacterium]
MSHQYSTFLVCGHLFGVDVTRVQEVIRPMAMTCVPSAPVVVRGLINLRGQIVTALDLRVRLGLGAHADDAMPMNVVVRADDGVVALLVDEIGDVLSADPAAWEHAPSTLPPSVRDLIPGAYKLDGRLLLQLDVDRVLDAAVAPAA